MERHRIAFGDWQTPRVLADAVLATLARECPEMPATIIEPTCGVGAFLAAAAERFPRAALRGFDISEEYVTEAQSQLPPSARVEVGDFFTVAWESVFRDAADPLFIVGNPPWVTTAGVTTVGGDNVPQKLNFKGLSGLDAMTGKSNFDISEWMLLRLVDALRTRRATVAVLCKIAVARRVLEHTAKARLPLAAVGMWRVDARTHFAAAVDAVLFVFQTGGASSSRCPVYASLEDRSAESVVDVVGGTLVADAIAFAATAHLAGTSDPEWRSGLKHDCSRVMELDEREGCLVNGNGVAVDVEGAYLFPFLKSSDVANDRLQLRRRVIVPQRRLGEDTKLLEQLAPRLWAYLLKNGAALSARKSSIYRTQPPFSIFGIGDYSFAPWKVAISGLYKRLAFTLVGPIGGQPVMVDDTCYFLPFQTEDEACRALQVLNSEQVQRFYRGRIFWDAKRPISKSILQSLDLRALLDGGAKRRSKEQQRLFL